MPITRDADIEAISGALLAQNCYLVHQADELAKLIAAKRRSHRFSMLETLDWIFGTEHPTNCYEFQDFLEGKSERPQSEA